MVLISNLLVLRDCAVLLATFQVVVREMALKGGYKLLSEEVPHVLTTSMKTGQDEAGTMVEQVQGAVNQISKALGMSKEGPPTAPLALPGVLVRIKIVMPAAAGEAGGGLKSPRGGGAAGGGGGTPGAKTGAAAGSSGAAKPPLTPGPLPPPAAGAGGVGGANSGSTAAVADSSQEKQPATPAGDGKSDGKDQPAEERGKGGGEVSSSSSSNATVGSSGSSSTPNAAAISRGDGSNPNAHSSSSSSTPVPAEPRLVVTLVPDNFYDVMQQVLMELKSMQTGLQLLRDKVRGVGLDHLHAYKAVVSKTLENCML